MIAARPALLLLVVIFAVVSTSAGATPFRRLWSFCELAGCADGGGSSPTLLPAANGNLYGTTRSGGSGNSGTIFDFDTTNGSFVSLYSFTGGADGAGPSSKLAIDGAGILYGTTYLGGSSRCGNSIGCGTIFEFDPSSRKITVLYQFVGGKQGEYPEGGLKFDSHGVLYGTTSGGGMSGVGTVFKFQPTIRKLTTLYSFTCGSDGCVPTAGVIFDASGNLYGTTVTGPGCSFCGTTYKLNTTTLVLTTLHNFTGGMDGSAAMGSLVFDNLGLLYGTTYSGGLSSCNSGSGCGTVFRLDPASKTLTTLHAFNGTDGSDPLAELVVDGSGNLYGTASHGGGTCSTCGTVFRLKPSTQGFQVLHTFAGPDGLGPEGGLVFDGSSLYGATSAGGTKKAGGTLFRIAP